MHGTAVEINLLCIGWSNKRLDKSKSTEQLWKLIYCALVGVIKDWISQKARNSCGN